MSLGNEPCAAARFFNLAASAFETGNRQDALEYLELVEDILPRDRIMTGFDKDAYERLSAQMGHDSAFFGWTYSQPKVA